MLFRIVRTCNFNHQILFYADRGDAFLATVLTLKIALFRLFFYDNPNYMLLLRCRSQNT